MVEYDGSSSEIRTGQRYHLVGFLRCKGFGVEETDGNGNAEIYVGNTHIGDIVCSNSEGTGVESVSRYRLHLNRPLPPDTGSRVKKYLR